MPAGIKGHGATAHRLHGNPLELAQKLPTSAKATLWQALIVKLAL